jgi:hypothetical protein
MIEKIRPTKQIKIPKYMMDRPLNPPKILKDTWERSGSTMSASPARAKGAAINNMAAKRNNENNILRLLIYNLLKYFVYNY